MNPQLTIIAIATVFICLCALQASSAPVGDDSSDVDESQKPHVRVRRFTCDVLGFDIAGVSLNSAACGLNCVRLGKSGGYCNDQRVCICR